MFVSLEYEKFHARNFLIFIFLKSQYFFSSPWKCSIFYFFPFHSPMATSLWVAVTTIKKDFPGLRVTKSRWFSRCPLGDAVTPLLGHQKSKYFIAQRLKGSGLCPFCRWVCWPTRWRLRGRRFGTWTCVWTITGRNSTPRRRCCSRCVCPGRWRWNLLLP